jgi:tRNA A-37 threonylcarbamoyl transferase component Bud32
VSRVASKALGFAGGIGAAIGIALAVLAPSPKAGAPVDGVALAGELDGRLREITAALHARTETIASLPSLQASVSTDAATVRDQTQSELAFRPVEGETITLAQVPLKGGASTPLLVWPASAEKATGLDKNGARVVIVGDRALVVDVASVTPQDADAAKTLRGAIAVSRPLDLSALSQKLDAMKASLRLSEDGHVLTFGQHAIGTGDHAQPLSLTSEAAKGLHAEVLAAPVQGGVPLRPVGIGLAVLSLLMAALALRGGDPTAKQVGLAATAAATGNTRDVTTPYSNAGAEEVRVGSIIQDTYEVTRLLGQGGMGAVWEAQHLRLPDKRVAVKLLVGEHVNEELFARFRREAEITSKLGHPNIVGVLDFNTLPGGAPYIVLELLEGESLSARIERGPIAVPDALRIAQQIGSALHAAHRADIVHRDLKPDNVFLVRAASDEHGEQVKVLDFGISKMRGNLSTKTQDATMLGTPQYMSPEQANGRNSEVDARSDVWALGAIVYEMITGQAAFGAETLAQIVVRIVVEPSPSLRDRPGVPIHVAAAVDRALAKESSARFADARAFITALTGASPSALHPAQSES